MRLRQLFEELGKEAAIIFGRFNPAHKGHRAAWEAASKSPIWYVGTNRTTVGPKDPLPFDVKIEVMKTIMPEIEGHILAETSWFTMAAAVYEKHGGDLTLYVVTDNTDKEWIMPTMLKQNGQQSDHGYYNFKNIEWREAPRLSSATDLRGAVMSGDREAFSRAAGVSAETPVMGKPFFDLVAEYLLPEQEKEQARRAAIDAKKANAAAKKASKTKPAPVEGVAEGSLEEYGDTAKGQKMLTKVQKRAVDRVVSKKAETDPKYAKKNADTANRAWDRMSDVEEGSGKRCMQCGMPNCKCTPGKCGCKPIAGWVPNKGFKKAMEEADAYDRDYASSVSGMDRAPDHRGLGQELAHETNNIAIAINGRTWKVVPGRGYADSKEEWTYLNNMKNWAEKKSASSGKKWTVSLTGADVTK